MAGNLRLIISTFLLAILVIISVFHKYLVLLETNDFMSRMVNVPTPTDQYNSEQPH